MIVKQWFRNHSQKAKEQVIEQAPGKPFSDESGFVLGYIKSAKQLDEQPDVIEFEIEVIR